MAGDPYKYFRIEARELLDQLGQGALDLEKGVPSGDLIARMLRLAHTLKGAARSVSLTEVEALCQACESVLSRITRGGIGLSGDVLSRLHAAIDGVVRLLAQGPRAVTVRERSTGYFVRGSVRAHKTPQLDHHDRKSLTVMYLCPHPS